MALNGRTQRAQAVALRNDCSLLIDAVEKSKGFTLHLVAADQEANVKLIRNDLKAAFGSRIVHIELPVGDSPIRYLIERISNTNPNKVIVVTGFKKHLPTATEPPPSEILDALNYEIFELRSHASQLVFLLPIEFVGYVQEYAPDIWELSSGLFAVEQLSEDRYLHTSHLICDFFTEVCGDLTYAQRLNRIAYYKALYVQRHPNGTIERQLTEYDMLGKLAILHFKLGAFINALKYLEEQMMVASAMDDKTLLPEIFNNLGMVNEAMGNYQDAFDYLQSAWDKADSAFKGNSHPSKALVLSNLSNVLCSLGHYQEAFLNCRQALRMCENKLGMRHQQLVPILINYGRILCYQNSLDASLDNYRRALQIVEKKLDLEHPYVTIILQNIGMVYFRQNKVDSARRYFYRTLEMTERVLGSEHPYLAVQLNNTGLAHCDQQNVGRAIKYFTWAYELRKSVVGPQDPIVADILANIGKALEIQLKHRDAQDAYRSALEIYRLKLPLDHPFIAELEASIHKLEAYMA